MITIYDEFETNFDNNEIGILRDVISAKITEELNGGYELEMEYPANGYLSEYIKEGNIRSNWEPATGEILGTSLSLYYNGVEITSASLDIKTVINNLGFISVYDRINLNNVILTLNNLRVLLTNTEINGSLKIETFLFQRMTIDSDDCLFIL